MPPPLQEGTMRAYLGGPVDPASLDICLQWRLDAEVMLADVGITAVNPNYNDCLRRSIIFDAVNC